MPKTTPAENLVVRKLAAAAFDLTFPTRKTVTTLVDASRPRVNGVQVVVSGMLRGGTNAGTVSLSVLDDQWTAEVSDTITGKSVSTVLTTHTPEEAVAFATAEARHLGA